MLEKITIADLKSKLKKGQPISGNKSVLILRLIKALTLQIPVGDGKKVYLSVMERKLRLLVMERKLRQKKVKVQ